MNQEVWLGLSMTKKIPHGLAIGRKKLIYERASIYKNYCNNNYNQIFEKLTLIQNAFMNKLKDTYYPKLPKSW